MKVTTDSTIRNWIHMPYCMLFGSGAVTSNGNCTSKQNGTQKLSCLFNEREEADLNTYTYLYNTNDGDDLNSRRTYLETYAYRYVYDRLIHLVPVWMAACVITVIGALINTLTLCPLLWLPDEPGNWYFLLCAVTLPVYLIIDALDGVQARLVDQDGPLEDVMDHGSDALFVVYMAIELGLALQLPSVDHLAACHLISVMFCLTHIEGYMDGYITYNKIDFFESLVAAWLVFILTFIFGSSLWTLPIPLVGNGLQLKNILLPMVATMTAIRCARVITAIVKKTDRKIELGDLIKAFVSLFLLAGLPWIYLDDSMTGHTYLATFAICLPVTKLTMRLVVLKITRSGMCFFDRSFVGPVFVLLMRLSGICSPVSALTIATVFSAVDMAVFFVMILTDLCNVLDVQLFILKKKHHT